MNNNKKLKETKIYLDFNRRGSKRVHGAKIFVNSTFLSLANSTDVVF